MTCNLQAARCYLGRVKVPRRKKRSRRSGCPISFALEILGDRWTLLVLRDIVFGGKRTFGEFLASEESIATNVLAERLGRLARAGIVRKTSAARSRTGYLLTERGIDLVPVLVDLAVWGAKHDPQTAAPKVFVRRATKDREALLVEIVAALRARQDSKT